MLLFSCSPSGWAVRALRMMPLRYGLGLTRQHTSLRIGSVEGRPRSSAERNDSRDQGVLRKTSLSASACPMSNSSTGIRGVDGREERFSTRSAKTRSIPEFQGHPAMSVSLRSATLSSKQDEENTVLRIDAVFVEDFRRRAHASDGSVENTSTRTSTIASRQSS